ncbi:MAG TPA: PAS domain-containing protein, partial [Candidatus Nitrosotalea sp.]|nr:PAS domain-containing protein [Candidatus Nitrosotalea sp.]
MDPHAAPSSFLLILLPLLALGFNLTLALSLAVGYRAFGGARLEAYGRLGRGLAGAGLALAIGVPTLLIFSLAYPPVNAAVAGGWLRALPVDALAAALLGLALYDRVMALGALVAGTLVALIWLGLAAWTLPLLFLPAIWLIAARRLPVALPPAAERLLFSYGAGALLPALPLLVTGIRLLLQNDLGGGIGLLLLALLHMPAVLAFAALLRLEDRRAEEEAKARQRGDIAGLPVIGQPAILARPAFDQELPTGAASGSVLDRAGFVAGTSGAAALQRSIADLPEGIAIFDAEDRLVAVNLVYFHLHTELATELRPGVHYADLTRLDVLRNGLTAEGVTGDPLRGRAAAAPARSRELPFTIEDRHADKPGAADQPAEADSGESTASAADPEALITALLDRHRHLPWRQEIRRPNGQWLRIIESKSADGGTLRIVSDITAVKARELRLTQLAERNAVLATAIASVSSGIIICDAQQPDLPITFANAAFCRISGYAMDEILGRNARFLQG